ncbi:hypothetical protein DE146DRAFT_629015 [Phaeosphaeria sp. MPI-PUGE-AT-0046c]|nr:hypothetical protein DE146DRAFT_629015 [Phaeosphaeria sp. MPI-PUGE-AT-0046c]
MSTSVVSSSLTIISACILQPSASPVGPCLDDLPLECRVLAGQNGPQISQNVKTCRQSLKFQGEICAYADNFAQCHSVTGAEQLGCLKVGLPVCDSCIEAIEAIPAACTRFYGDPAIVNYDLMARCTSALSFALFRFATKCFSAATGLHALRCINIERCLCQNLRICSDGTTNTSIEMIIAPHSASLSSTGLSTTSSSPKPSPSPALKCLEQLPAEFEKVDRDNKAVDQLNVIG